MLKDHHYDPWNWHEYLSDEPAASGPGRGGRGGGGANLLKGLNPEP